MRDFKGGVFSSKIEGGRAGADIQIQGDRIAALCTDGDVFELPFRDCHLEIGGASGRMFFCRNAAKDLTIFCEDLGFPQALSTEAAGILDKPIREILAHRRQKRRQWRLVGLAACVGLFILFALGYFGILAGARAAIGALPRSVDEQLGAMAFQSMKLEGPVMTTGAAADAVQQIVARLAATLTVHDIKFEVHVVDASIVNAFALPGGYIVVYTGLIEAAENAEQVAAVVAHEMAHVTMRHGLQRIGQAIGLMVATQVLLGDAHGLFGAGADLLTSTTINSYSRAHETEADTMGVAMLHEAAIDPMTMAAFFTILDAEHGDVPDSLSWFSTHPQHDARVQAVREQVATLPDTQYRALAIDWDQVRRQTTAPNHATTDGGATSSR